MVDLSMHNQLWWNKEVWVIRNAVMVMIFFIFQGELFEVLEDDKCLPEEQVQAIAKQLVFMSSTICYNSI